MKSTDAGTDQPRHPAVLGDEFERLHAIFYTRMRSDQLRLATLAALLARIAATIFQAAEHR